MHNDDGTTTDPATGAIVTNNSLTQSFVGITEQGMTRVTGIDTADRNMDNKDNDDAKKAAISTLDGLIHNADGTTTDPTTMQVVNNELRVNRQSFAQGTPFDNTQQHDATMNNAASIDAIRNHDIAIQKMKDEWRYNNSGPTSMTA